MIVVTYIFIPIIFLLLKMTKEFRSVKITDVITATPSAQLFNITSNLILDSTASSYFKQIIESLNQLKPVSTSLFTTISSQSIGAFIAGLFTIITTLILLYLKEPILRRLRKTKIVPLRVIRHHQNKGLIVYRLIILNDSNYLAKNVEVDIKEIIDDGGVSRINFVQSPLNWTHLSQKPRDIYPHQDAWLDLFDVTLTQGKYMRLSAPNISGLPDLPYLKQGKTKLVLNYYQENGQNGTIELQVEWNGNETFQGNDLPVVTILKS